MISMFLMYQLKVAVILASFYLLYALLLRRETWHRLNRAILLSSMALSLIIPLCKITIHREAPSQSVAPQYLQSFPMVADVTEAAVPVVDIPRTETFTTPAYSEIPVNITETVTAQEQLPETTVTINTVKPTRTISWQQVLFLTWAIGALFFLIRLVVSIISISNIIMRGRVACTRDGVRIVVTRMDTNPFSWMNNIVLTQQDYDSGCADAIIEHELSHVRNHHSWDLLATDLFTAIQWFNPAVYDLRSSLQEVHEYQADNSVIRHGFNVRNYQMMLIGKLALENGFSIANNFSKKHLSNRISMMNKKNSPFARAWKAMFVPVLTGLFLATTAVIVYDCAPAKSTGMDDEFKELQKHYGQGAFVAANYIPCNIVMKADHQNAEVTVFGSKNTETVSLESLPSYLEKQDDHEKLRPNICVQSWGVTKDNTEVLQELKPLLTKLEAKKIRSLVVPTEEMMKEYYYSTYKYARIYETEQKGNYILIHNDLAVNGDAVKMAEWIGLLNIQYVAFYTVGYMPISDAALMMDAAKSRGIMTFICCSQNGVRNQKLTPSYLRENPGIFHATILPVDRNLKSEFKGKKLMDVAMELEKEYTLVYLDKAQKVITSPNSYSCDQWFNHMTLLFCEDEFIMMLNPLTMSKNSWCRPDDVVIRVDGKEYKRTKQEGFQNFSDYPWDTADGYANGSLCWGPEISSMLTTIHFEPIPFDSEVMDIMQNENKEYVARGVILKTINTMEDIPAGDLRVNMPSYSALGGARLNNIPGTGSVSVTRMEFLKDRTNVVFKLRMEAPFEYPGFIGSDMTLTLMKNGKEYKIQGIEGGVLDKDFDRGGDHVTTTLLLHFPVMDPNDVFSEMTQEDINRREPTPNGAEEMKTMTLEGTVCHQKVSIPVTVPKVEM